MNCLVVASLDGEGGVGGVGWGLSLGTPTVGPQKRFGIFAIFNTFKDENGINNGGNRFKSKDTALPPLRTLACFIYKSYQVMDIVVVVFYERAGLCKENNRTIVCVQFLLNIW